jgi:hypothetical protein
MLGIGPGRSARLLFNHSLLFKLGFGRRGWNFVDRVGLRYGVEAQCDLIPCFRTELSMISAR